MPSGDNLRAIVRRRPFRELGYHFQQRDLAVIGLMQVRADPLLLLFAGENAVSGETPRSWGHAWHVAHRFITSAAGSAHFAYEGKYVRSRPQ